MRVVAIDASPGRGVVTRSVEEAARSAEQCGARVERIRLADLDVRTCTDCGMCRYTGSCKIDDDLPRIVEAIATADGVILGLPSYFRKADRAVQALLDRLGSYFPDTGQLHLPGLGTRDVPPAPVVRAVRRAVIITACNAPEPLATFFGYTTGPIRELRAALGQGGIKTIGSLSMTGAWRRPQFDAWERDKAVSLGRVVAGRI